MNNSVKSVRMTISVSELDARNIEMAARREAISRSSYIRRLIKLSFLNEAFQHNGR